MANRIQHLRGSNTEHSTYTGAKGEISLVTDTSANRIPTGELRVHDGTTAGGLPVKLGTTDKPLTSNIVMGSGYGIDFASYATSGNPSSNLLDDYEEGTWTASYGSSGSNTGSYRKIGNLVFANVTINNTSQTFSTVTGLPFTGNQNNLAGKIGRILGFSGFDRSNLGCEYTSTQILLLNSTAAAATVSSSTGTTRLDLTVIYTTA